MAVHNLTLPLLFYGDPAVLMESEWGAEPCERRNPKANT
jgi:hypothetical protein